MRKITNIEGVDIVIEHVGPATWEESVQIAQGRQARSSPAARPPGRKSISICGFFSRANLSLLGSYMGTMSELHEVLGHVFAGRLKPVIDRIFPLSETRAAHEYMEKSQMFGKIVLNV